MYWFIAIATTIVYLYFKVVLYTYWKRHGVPHEKARVPFGNFDTAFFLKRITLGNYLKKSYENFKKHPYHGMYALHKPILMINDPELIKHILVKDFANFCDRGLYLNEKVDPLNAHLFFLTGDKWRTLRAKLSPTFTAGKLKHMFPYIMEIGNQMVKTVDENLEKSEILELKDIVARYTTDTIFSLAFGYNSNTLKNPDNECRYYGSLAIETEPWRNALAFFMTNLMYALNIRLVHQKVTDYFVNLFQYMIEKRKFEVEKRNDFLNLLIELMENEEIENKNGSDFQDKSEIVNAEKLLTTLQANAQAFVFFIAGFETSSSIVTHCLYELALNPDIQEKLHEEINELYRNGEESSYDKMMQLEYLDKVFYETMRKHPSVPFLNRICINDYKIPNSDFCIPKGMPLIISISGLQRDPDIYPNPDTFDPERFSKECVESRHPYAYLAFGDGPRICIGKRLGILLSKIALCSLLSNHQFFICDKTPIPNYYSTNSVLQTPRDGIYLKVVKRKSVPSGNY